MPSLNPSLMRVPGTSGRSVAGVGHRDGQELAAGERGCGRRAPEEGGEGGQQGEGRDGSGGSGHGRETPIRPFGFLGTCASRAVGVASASMDAQPSPLLSVADLAELVTSGDSPVIVDLRWYLGKPGAGRAAYEEGHLPGAIFLDLDDDLADLGGFGAPGRHPLPDPAAFAARMAAAGIGDGGRVVGYDDVGGWVAARLWWMLDSLGFGRRGTAGEWAGVLDGGIKAWTEGGPPPRDRSECRIACAAGPAPCVRVARRHRA